MKDSSSAPDKADRTVSRRIGVCSWSLRPTSPDDLIDALERLGIAAVQLDLSTLVSQPDQWAKAATRIRKKGITIASGMMRMAGEDYSTLETIRATGGVRPDATWDANRAHAEEVAALAAKANIELVTFHAGFIPEEESSEEHAVIVERLRTMADIFMDEGVHVAFETGQETADTLLEALAAIDRTTVGVNFDPANMTLYGTGDPIASLKQLAPFVRQVHIKDAQPAETPGSWGREVPIGEGAVDWEAFMAAANSISPAVNFIIEREAGEGREADVAKARDLLTQYV